MIGDVLSYTYHLGKWDMERKEDKRWKKRLVKNFKPIHTYISTKERIEISLTLIFPWSSILLAGRIFSTFDSTPWGLPGPGLNCRLLAYGCSVSTNLLVISKPRFPHLWDGYANNAYFTKWFLHLNELIKLILSWVSDRHYSFTEI